METNVPRLLIVDDEADTCANLSDIFTDLSYRVDIAHNGIEALKLVDQYNYDVALLDLKMPGMNGLELYREIRRRSADTVAIVVTANANSDMARSVLQSGAWRVMPKPVDFNLLLSHVDEALSQPLVLVVDDDHDLCHALWDLFRERGFRMGMAHDVRDARNRLHHRSYQIVLIDMKLPHGDGTEVLRMVRSENPEARALIITGQTEMHSLVQQALASGADAVCYKPFNVDELLKTVESLAR
jgi:two-component system, NtrC family, response regulator HydG